MGLDTTKVRHQIRYILRRSGRTRSKKLADEVIKKIGSEKTVYRQIKAMCESGEIRPIVENRADVTYELVKLADYNEKYLEFYLNRLSDIDKRLKTFHEQIMNKDTMPMYIQQLSTIVLTIKQLQKIEARFRMLSIFGSLRNTKSFAEAQTKIEETWKFILGLIGHNPEKHFFQELMINFPVETIIEARSRKA